MADPHLLGAVPKLVGKGRIAVKAELSALWRDTAVLAVRSDLDASLLAQLRAVDDTSVLDGEGDANKWGGLWFSPGEDLNAKAAELARKAVEWKCVREVVTAADAIAAEQDRVRAAQVEAAEIGHASAAAGNTASAPPEVGVSAVANRGADPIDPEESSGDEEETLVLLTPATTSGARRMWRLVDRADVTKECIEYLERCNTNAPTLAELQMHLQSLFGPNLTEFDDILKRELRMFVGDVAERQEASPGGDQSAGKANAAEVANGAVARGAALGTSGGGGSVGGHEKVSDGGTAMGSAELEAIAMELVPTSTTQTTGSTPSSTQRSGGHILTNGGDAVGEGTPRHVTTTAVVERIPREAVGAAGLSDGVPSTDTNGHSPQRQVALTADVKCFDCKIAFSSYLELELHRSVTGGRCRSDALIRSSMLVAPSMGLESTPVSPPRGAAPTSLAEVTPIIHRNVDDVTPGSVGNTPTPGELATQMSQVAAVSTGPVLTLPHGSQPSALASGAADGHRAPHSEPAHSAVEPMDPALLNALSWKQLKQLHSSKFQKEWKNGQGKRERLVKKLSRGWKAVEGATAPLDIPIPSGGPVEGASQNTSLSRLGKRKSSSAGPFGTDFTPQLAQRSAGTHHRVTFRGVEGFQTPAQPPLAKAARGQDSSVEDSRAERRRTSKVDDIMREMFCHGIKKRSKKREYRIGAKSILDSLYSWR